MSLEPLEAVNQAILFYLPADYEPKPIDFTGDIKQIRARIAENKVIAEGRDY